jgi:hypothetical protein
MHGEVDTRAQADLTLARIDALRRLAPRFFGQEIRSSDLVGTWTRIHKGRLQKVRFQRASGDNLTIHASWLATPIKSVHVKPNRDPKEYFLDNVFFGTGEDRPHS